MRIEGRRPGERAAARRAWARVIPDADARCLTAAEGLVEELLRTSFWLADVLSVLLEDLPGDAFPGEEQGAVLVEMVAGSSLPAIEAAGAPACLAATDLVIEIRERVREDLRAAAMLARGCETLL